MKNILKYLYHKYKTYDTDNLSVGLRCRPIKKVKGIFENYRTSIVKPCRLQIVTDVNFSKECRYVRKNFGYTWTILGKCPTWANTPVI